MSISCHKIISNSREDKITEEQDSRRVVLGSWQILICQSPSFPTQQSGTVSDRYLERLTLFKEELSWSSTLWGARVLVVRDCELTARPFFAFLAAFRASLRLLTWNILTPFFLFSTGSDLREPISSVSRNGSFGPTSNVTMHQGFKIMTTSKQEGGKSRYTWAVKPEHHNRSMFGQKMWLRIIYSFSWLPQLGTIQMMITNAEMTTLCYSIAPLQKSLHTTVKLISQLKSIQT